MIESSLHFGVPRGLAGLALLLPVCAAADEPYLVIRNHNPLLQIFGLPAFETAVSTRGGEVAYQVDLDISNHAEENSTAAESITLDGESYYLTMAVRYGYSDKLVFGIDIPLVAHAGGFLDAPIENWHDFWGLSNTKRQGPRNELEFRYNGPQLASYELVSSGFGMGDIRLNAAASWRATEQFGMAMEIYAQSAYYDSALDEIGNHSVQVAVGGFYLTGGNSLRLSVALIQDLFSDSTTDMAIQLSVSGVIRSRDERR